MYLAIIRNQDNEKEVKLFWNDADFRREYWNGKAVIWTDLTIRGKRFQDRQNCLRKIAETALQISRDPCADDAVWWLGDEMQEYFQKNGKRYGLLRELREMGIL